jgi:uncharacterized protein YdhG (YjbR/CyaY superfamily)
VVNPRVEIKMKTKRLAPKTIDQYIASFPPNVQGMLEKIRATIQKAAPDAQEAISYQIPAFKLCGNLIFFAAFKKHIGVYPRVAALEKELSKYKGGKGTVQFPLDKPIPLSLIARLTKARVKANLAKAAAKSTRKR